MNVQVVVAAIDVAQGANVHLQGGLTQNKPNLSSEGPEIYEGPRSTDVSFAALLILTAFDALTAVRHLLWLPRCKTNPICRY